MLPKEKNSSVDHQNVTMSWSGRMVVLWQRDSLQDIWQNIKSVSQLLWSSSPQTSSYLFTPENQQFLNTNLKWYTAWLVLGFWERWKFLELVKCGLFCQSNKWLLSGCCKSQTRYHEFWSFLIFSDNRIFSKDPSPCFIKSDLCVRLYHPNANMEWM